MKQPLTAFYKVLLLALALGTGFTSRGQTYTPVALTGFTHDIIANGTGAVSTTTTADIDGSAATGGTGYDLMAQDYVGPGGQVPNTTTYPAATYPALETSGLITSALNSAITYQLGPYSGNNALRLFGAGATGTLSFATPQPAAELYVIGTSGNAPSVLDITVNFADGSTQLFASQTIADWFAANQPNVVREKLGRVSRGDNSVQYTTGTSSVVGPRIYQLKLVLDAANVAKNITGLTFSKPAAAGNTVLLAVTAGTYPICSAMPTGLTAAATTTSGGTTALTSACSSTNIYLSLNGLANQSGYTFQWQSSTDNVTFTNISGATSSTYTATGQTASTYYRAQVTCAFGGAAANSAAVQVQQSPVTNCYCVPSHSSTSTSYTTVTSVSLPGDAGTLSNAPGLLTSTSPGYVSAYYAIYPASTTTTTLSPNASYTLGVSVPAFARASVWIDYDQNGTFDANEFTILRTTTSATSPVYLSSATTLVALITPPATALSGPTRMRIRTDYYNNTVLNTYTGACSTTTYGEALDYTITIATPVPCAGTPPAITATASVATACAGTSVSLSATGVVPGTTGLSYQWQSSPAGANTFTNLGTAQTMPGYTVASQTASTDYRVVVTCTASNQSTTSSLISVTTSFLNCYCTPVSTGTNEYIKSVTMPGTPGFTNATNANSTSGYGDFTTNTALTTTLNQGATYLNGVSVTVRANNTNSQGGMWIDYDHSGTFDANEYTLIGTSSAIATDVVFPVTLVVPSTAQLGQTRVRVRWRNGSFTSADACVTGTTTWYGETEDYFITIAAPTTCSAPPATVAAAADVTSACSNASFTLSTNSVPASLGGYTYQWQSRTGTNAFADIAGATTNPYTVTGQAVATDYRLVVGCQYGGTPVTSNTVSVGQNSFDQCYCTASSTNVCSNYGVITNVSLGTINNASGCTSTNSYSSYVSPTTPTTTTTLTPGTTATLTLGVASATTAFTYNYGVWIDFDHNGTFDASEFVANSLAPLSSTTATASITIPPVSGSVLLGATRMRIRTNAGQYGVFAASGACGAVYNGETEDYLVTLAPCTPTTATFSYGSPATFCVSGATNPTVTLGTGATAGTFSSTAGLTINATTGAITLATSTPGTYTVTNTVAATTTTCSSTATTTVTINAAPTAGFSYPTTAICAGSATTLTPTLATGATAGTYSLPTATGLSVNATTGVVTVGATAAAGTYTVTNTIAAAGGCSQVLGSATFTIAAPTTATFSYAGSPYCVSGSSNPMPTVTGTAGGTFSSTTGLSLNASTGLITLGTSTPGTYTVTYTVGGACGSSSTQTVTINAAPVATFTYTTPGVGAACAGGTGTFTPTMGTGATRGTFTAAPAGLSLNATTGVISLATSTAGTYTITNTVTGNCAAVTGTSSFTVNPIPATPTLTATGTATTGITLTSSAATGNQFYLNGVAVSGATAQSYFVSASTYSGSYTVVVTSAAGCTSAASAPVSAVVTATHAPLAGTSLTLAPNPTRDGILTLALSGYHEPVTLTVINTLGQRVYEGTLTGNALTQQQTLNLSALPTGMYLLQARTASGGVEVRRIVRE